jgi:GTPase
MFSARINPPDLMARLKMKEPETVRVLAISDDGEMLVLRENGTVRSIHCIDDIVKRCDNVSLTN